MKKQSIEKIEDEKITSCKKVTDKDTTVAPAEGDDNILTETFKADRDDVRLRQLYMYRILLEHSSEEHPLSTPQITEYMKKEYGIHMHRTTVHTDIALLQAAGFDVVPVRHRAWNYYLSGRIFTMPELKLLIDAVQSSKFITEKKSVELIDKLTNLAPQSETDKLTRTTRTTNRAKSENEKGYFIVDAINSAMNTGKKISFKYFDYSGKKKKFLRNDGNPYTVSPYDLLWDGDFYYLIGYCDERGDVRIFRVDHIDSEPTILEDEAVRRPRGYSLKKYTQESFRMFASDQTADATLICENSVMRAIIDKFGTRVHTKTIDDQHFIASVKICPSPNFYRWVFGWEGKIMIEGPEELKDGYLKMLMEAVEKINHKKRDKCKKEPHHCDSLKPTMGT